jgi:hypothetical protein
LTWIADDPEALAGRAVGTGQCVAFVRQACGAPHTSLWRRGRKARGGNLEAGTAIATFDANGYYGNHTDGRSHCAIFVAEEATGGLLVWDQWKGHVVAERVIRFKGGAGTPNNDGDAYYTIESIA